MAPSTSHPSHPSWPSSAPAPSSHSTHYPSPSPIQTHNTHPSTGQIIISIDFGTTHSAVAWAHTDTPDEYEVITAWPGQSGGGSDSGKVPSDVSYGPPVDGGEIGSPQRIMGGRSSTSSGVSSSASDGSGGSGESVGLGLSLEELPVGFKWGFQVPPSDPHRISNYKIHLLSSPLPPSPFHPPLPSGHTPLSITTHYLLALRLHTLHTLTRRLGPHLLSSTPLSYVLTIPAISTDSARTLTLRAAIAAGLVSTLTGAPPRLLTEPEAAAEYALRSLRPSQVKLGDCFTLVDLGGATADLISYAITSLAPLGLREVVVGTGGLCGGVHLDRRFEEWVKRRIGPERWGRLVGAGGVGGARKMWCMMRYWEREVKREFSCLDDEGAIGEGGEERSDRVEDDPADFWVPVVGLEDDPEIHLRDGFLRMTRKEVKHIFSPVVSQIISLISTQVLNVIATGHHPPNPNSLQEFPASNPHVSAILLVGGLGSSEYVFNRIRAFHQERIPVLQPRNAWTAVVRGAIIRGLTPFPPSPPLEPVLSPNDSDIPIGLARLDAYPQRSSSLSRRTSSKSSTGSPVISNTLSTNLALHPIPEAPSSAPSPSDPPSLRHQNPPPKAHQYELPQSPRNARALSVRSLAPTVHTRLSRLSYGVLHDLLYDPILHSPSERYLHPLRGEYVVRDRMRWYIKRGDPIQYDRPVAFQFYRTIPLEKFSKEPEILGSVGENSSKIDLVSPISPPAEKARHSHRASRQHPTTTLRTQLYITNADPGRDGEGLPKSRVRGELGEDGQELVRRLCTLSAKVGRNWCTLMRNREGERFWKCEYELRVGLAEGGGVGFECVVVRGRWRDKKEGSGGGKGDGKGGEKEWVVERKKVGRVEVRYE